MELLDDLCAALCSNGNITYSIMVSRSICASRCPGVCASRCLMARPSSKPIKTGSKQSGKYKPGARQPGGKSGKSGSSRQSGKYKPGARQTALSTFALLIKRSSSSSSSHSPINFDKLKHLPRGLHAALIQLQSGQCALCAAAPALSAAAASAASASLSSFTAAPAAQVSTLQAAIAPKSATVTATCLFQMPQNASACLVGFLTREQPEVQKWFGFVPSLFWCANFAAVYEAVVAREVPRSPATVIVCANLGVIHALHRNGDGADHLKQRWLEHLQVSLFEFRAMEVRVLNAIEFSSPEALAGIPRQ